MATTFPSTQPIPEASCRLYSTQLVGLDGLPLSSAQISSIRFTLRDARSNNVINDRFRTEVKNVNGGELGATGLFTMEFNERDTIAIGTTKLQKRRALFTVYFDSCTENHEVFFFVESLYDVESAIPYVLDELRVADTIAAVLV